MRIPIPTERPTRRLRLAGTWTTAAPGISVRHTEPLTLCDGHRPGLVAARGQISGTASPGC
jgi:hypothetical protein